MNIYPSESPLHQAFAHVALESDRVWWNEKDYGDVYKMANLNLYKTLLRSTNRAANKIDNIDLVMSTLETEKTLDSSVKYFLISDALEKKNEQQQLLPYSIETLDDLILYNSVHQSSIKKLWSQEKSMQELEESGGVGGGGVGNESSQDLLDKFDEYTTNLELHFSELNANVPEFYPSVLLPATAQSSATRFPSVYHSDYQAELFPFKDDTKWDAHQDSSSNVVGLNRSSDFDWVISANTIEETQNDNKVAVPSSSSQNSSYPVTLSNTYNFATADFPELPKAQDSSTDIIAKTNLWLESAFPKRADDFHKISEVVAHFDTLIRKLTNCHQEIIGSQSKPQDRRLYRDVLAQKEGECEEKEDGGLEVKYEELEREALAQYRASETSLVPTVVTELSPELEENLEREALEQYSGEFHLDARDAAAGGTTTVGGGGGGGGVGGGGGAGSTGTDSGATLSLQDTDNHLIVITKEDNIEIPAISSHSSVNLEEDEDNSIEKLDVELSEEQRLTQDEYAVKVEEVEEDDVDVDDDDDDDDDGDDDEEDEEKTAAAAAAAATSSSSSKRPSQQQCQNYTNKCKNRQRKGNKKRKGRWKGGGNTGGNNNNSNSSTMTASNKVSVKDFIDSSTAASSAASVADTCNESNAYMTHTIDGGGHLFTSTCYRNINCALYSKSKPNSYFSGGYEIERKRLSTLLKQKALNYLKGVELNLTDEIKRNTNKNTIKQLLYKGPLPASIVQNVKLEEIEDAETYKQYAKEVSSSARTLLLNMYKRIRTELMDTTTAGNIQIVAPTTAEKRKVRHKIQKCVQLLDRADLLKRVPRKPIESAKREVASTLKLLHRTMEVVYALKDMSKLAYEDSQYLIKNKEILLDIYNGVTYINDKSEYIKQKLCKEERNLLLLLLFPRKDGILLDRISQRLTVNCQEPQHLIGYIHASYIIRNMEQFRINNFDLLTQTLYNNNIRIINKFEYDSYKRRDIWSEDNWQHWLTVGNRFYASVTLILYGMIDHISYLKDDLLNDPSYIMKLTERTFTLNSSCCFCNKKHNAIIVNNSIGSCLLTDIYIRARSPLRLLLESVIQNRRPPFWIDQLLPSPSTSCTQIVQTEDIDDDDDDDDEHDDDNVVDNNNNDNADDDDDDDDSSKEEGGGGGGGSIDGIDDEDENNNNNNNNDNNSNYRPHNHQHDSYHHHHHHYYHHDVKTSIKQVQRKSRNADSTCCLQ